MILLFVTILSVALFLFNYSLNNELFYPPALFTLLWSFILAACVIFTWVHPGDVYLIDASSLVVFLTGEILFTAGGLLALNRTSKAAPVRHKPIIRYSLDKYLFAVLLAVLPYYLYKINSIINASSIKDGSIFIILRYELSIEQVDIGPVKYINSVALFAFGVLLYRFGFTGQQSFSLKEKIYKYTFYALVFTYAVLSSGRTYLLFLLCMYVGSKAIQQRIRFYHYLAMLVLVLVVFAAFATLLNKGGNADLSFAENIASIAETIVVYLLGGVYAFNSVMQAGFTLDYGENTFRFFIALFNSAGLTGVKPKELVMDFVNTPVWSNVYAVYYPYIKDFWYFGLLFMLLFGFVHTWLYCKAKQGFGWFFGYVVLLYPLIMSFFQDQYVSLLSTWLQLFVFACIARFFIRYNPAVNVSAKEMIVE